jgi:hypothetical protein
VEDEANDVLVGVCPVFSNLIMKPVQVVDHLCHLLHLALVLVAGIYSDFSGFILALWYDSWPEFLTHKSLIILLYDLDSMPCFFVFLLIFYHPRVRVWTLLFLLTLPAPS